MILRRRGCGATSEVKSRFEAVHQDPARTLVLLKAGAARFGRRKPGILGSCVLAKEAMAALDVIAPASSSWILPPISFARHVTAVAKFLLIAIERKLRPANFAS
jgi:hypothetical protein